MLVYTDVTADLTAMQLKQHKNIRVLEMSFAIGEREFVHFADWREMPYETMCKELRAVNPKVTKLSTSQVTAAQFKKAVEPELQKGEQVLALIFSSGISGTYAQCAQASAELSKTYPGQIEVVDILSTTGGMNRFVIRAAKMSDAGKTLDEVSSVIRDEIRYNETWFTVPDIKYLTKSGRCSRVEGFVGGLAGIKPVLHVYEEKNPETGEVKPGKLVPYKKVFGPNNAIKTLIDKMDEAVRFPDEQSFHLFHCDYEDGIQIAKEQIHARWPSINIDELEVLTISPIVAMHVGRAIGLSFDRDRDAD